MIITMIRKDWYVARSQVNRFAVAVGYGSDIPSAVVDCLNDKKIIEELL